MFRLIRAELTDLERGEDVARRKAIDVACHPETATENRADLYPAWPSCEAWQIKSVHHQPPRSAELRLPLCER
jgi:hypothetical protein